MNDTPHNMSDTGLPAELRGVASSLDRLGALDRAAAGELFEARLAATTRPGVAMDESPVRSLARAERDAAPVTLEDRIFVATRALLQPAPAETAPVRVEFRPARRFLRIAAAVAIVAGAALASYLSIPFGNGANAGNGTLAHNSGASTDTSQLENDFADLASILSVALGSSESDASASSRETLESSEFEFPQFDLLSVDREDSL